MGGIALINVGLMIGGAKAPEWARYGGLLVCAAMGVTCLVLAIVRYRQKKPVRARYQPRRAQPVTLARELSAGQRPSDLPRDSD
jgi:hypothetical protein